MALPRIKISYQNGQLGAVAASPDGLLGLIATATAVPDKFSLNQPYILSSYDDLAALGITAENNAGVEKLIRDFYAEAGAGTQVYLMGVADTVSMSDMLDQTEASNARKLVEASGGTIRGIIVKYIPADGYTPTIEDGLDSEVYAAIEKGQELAGWAASSKYAPIFVIVEGCGYSGSPVELKDLAQQTDNRVGVLIGDTEADTSGAAMGLIAGRIATIPVHRNIGRVKDGAVSSLAIFIGSTPAELADVESIHNKAFITFRTFVGRSGYFFSDDCLATLPTDDYKYITYRRTIDKAYRVIYDTLINELLDTVPVTPQGTIIPAFAKSWERLVVNAIATQMTVNGELSVDPTDANDQGVTCFIDSTQNIISTGQIKVTARVRPYGYARYVDVLLGFDITQG